MGVAAVCAGAGGSSPAWSPMAHTGMGKDGGAWGRPRGQKALCMCNCLVHQRTCVHPCLAVLRVMARGGGPGRVAAAMRSRPVPPTSPTPQSTPPKTTYSWLPAVHSTATRLPGDGGPLTPLHSPGCLRVPLAPTQGILVGGP